jgi:dTDP-glucose 4,6-dehydratase
MVTGAAGFIGSAVCRYLRGQNLARVVGIDKMSYAASRESLAILKDDTDFTLIEQDLCQGNALVEIFAAHQPDYVMHLAAETHVDRSIDRPGDFIQANIVATFALLEIARHYWATLPEDRRTTFRLLHVSTDEVYGSLSAEGRFTETMAYAPNSPYAATKAAADHLARAWHKTYGLPVVISNCSNNYGPFQFPEKLLPLMITKALAGQSLPVYGQGHNVRDWLYVDDHAEALHLILTKGRIGEKYNVGGAAEICNIDLVEQLCALLDTALPEADCAPHKSLIHFVADRPGHDERYAMDFDKLHSELGWNPRTNLAQGLQQTLDWYLANRDWCNMVKTRYDGARLGKSQSA